MNIREQINLNGKWNFQLDLKEIGEKKNWFSEKHRFNNVIKVPGCWQIQGYGKDVIDPINNFRWEVVSDSNGWYKRNFFIPLEWKGGKVWLEFKGLYPLARIWVNEKFTAEHTGPFSPIRIDISKLARFGESNIVSVLIKDKNRFLGGDCYNMCLWSGIYQNVILEKTSDVWIKNIFFIPNINENKVKIIAQISNERPGKFSLNFEIKDKAGKQIAEAKHDISLDHKGEYKFEKILWIPDAKLWSPENPYLYHGIVSINRGNDCADALASKFGMRELKIKERNIFLNNKKIFLRGYGDDAVYPDTVCPPADKESYLKLLKAAKDYGFNFVRHHTHFLPEAYFDATDEIGMFVQPELHHYPEMKIRNISKNELREARKLIRAEWESCIVNLRNHPSIMVYCMGNEMNQHVCSVALPERERSKRIDFLNESYKQAKELDPTKLVLRTSGVVLEDIGIGAKTDLEAVCVDEEPSLSIEDFKYGINNYLEKIEKPFYLHEYCYESCYPSPKLKKKYKGIINPYWIDVVEKEFRKNKVIHLLPKFITNTEKLQAICRRFNIEEARKIKEISGYTLWLLKDTVWAVEGLVDDFADPKNVTPEEFTRTNGAQVLLLDIARWCFWSEEKVKANIILSNHSAKEIRNASLILQLIDNSKAIFTASKYRINGKGSWADKIASFKFKLPLFNKAKKLKLKVSLKAQGLILNNEWNIWVFPQDLLSDLDKKTAILMYDPQLRLEALEKRFLFLRFKRHDDSDFYRDREARWLWDWQWEYKKRRKGKWWWQGRCDLLITGKLTEQVLKCLDKGARVLLISRGDFPEVHGTHFRTIPFNWKSIGSSGTVINNHPAMKDFPHEGFFDLQGYNLCKGANWGVNLIDLEAWPVKIEPIIRSIPSYRRYKNQAYLVEVQVGKGKLLITTLNFEETAGKYPEADFLMAKLIRYCLSEKFKPVSKISVSKLQKMQRSGQTAT